MHDESRQSLHIPSLVLSGPSGTGKDLLLAALAGCRPISRYYRPVLHIETVMLQGYADPKRPGSRFEDVDRRFSDAYDAGLLILSAPEL